MVFTVSVMLSVESLCWLVIHVLQWAANEHGEVHGKDMERYRRAAQPSAFTAAVSLSVETQHKQAKVG